MFLLRPERTETTGGTAEISFAPVGEVFAELVTLSRGSRFVGGRPEGYASHRLRLRYRDDVTSGWMITSGSRRFRVLAVSPIDTRNAEIVCMLEEEGL
ncbi:MAG: phage head closure protein [Rhodobacteraceae bacterium]|nr:phage head closure protein [Paracoccaceae bacterium]